MSLISDFVCAECEAEFKTVLGGDSMWVLREKTGDGRETLNVNGLVAETKSMVVLPGFCVFCLASGLFPSSKNRRKVFHTLENQRASLFPWKWVSWSISVS
ncbi:hypothetical protein Peur_063028 [Populus x canadensis]